MKPLFTIVCLLWLSYLSALAQPRDLRAETVPSTLKIRLTWTDNTLNETKFEIERAVSTSNDFNVIGSVNRNVVTYEDVDPAKEPSTLYKYRVRGIISEALGIKLGTDYSNVASARTSGPPDRPVVTRKTALRVPNSEKMAGVKLEWTDNADDEIGYFVNYKKYGSSTYTNVALPPNTRSYEIRVAEGEAWPGCDGRIEFTVMCYNLAGQIEATDKRFDAPDVDKPSTPQNLRATASIVDSKAAINLTWAGTNTAESVENRVYVRISKGDAASARVITLLNTSLNSHVIDTGLEFGATYKIEIWANNCAGNSPYSNDVTITTPANPANTPPAAPEIHSSLSQNWTRNSDRVTEVTALWHDRSNNETGFEIQWGTTEQFADGTASVDANITQHKIEGSWP
ncbi:hypothetical protein, partial [Spirosoma sp.]|uniref:hypothetical protein n=1 Tax=Spirosoma sp. TaxID=1899569 RepID=UPI003B3B2C2F